MTMNSWHATVGFTTSTPFSEDAPFDVAETLAEHGAVMSVARDFSGGDVLLTVDAETVLAAANRAVGLVHDALDSAGIDHAPLVAIQVQDEEAFDRELATPAFPEVVGYAEIADMAGVSRQRARQFADKDDFPKPVIKTAQGPLMSKAAVASWLDRRSKTGRSAA